MTGGVWADAVRAVIPGGRVVAAEALAGGNFTDVVRLTVQADGVSSVRLVGRSSRDVRGDELVSRGAAVVACLREGTVPAPVVVWRGRLAGAGAGRFGALLEFIDGGVLADGDSRAERLGAMAACLAALHATPLDGLPALEPFPVVPSGFLLDWIAPHPKASTAVELLAQVAPTVSPSGPVLVHGDFWTGNLLWDDGRVVGVLDWDNVSVGSPAVDLAKARLDLALRFGVDAADELLDRYGPSPVDQSFWDLRLALDGMPDPGRWWLPTYRRLGIAGLVAEEVNVRFERYLERCLGRVVPRTEPG